MHEIVVTRWIGNQISTTEVVICKGIRSCGPFALTSSTLARIERLATDKKTNRYDGETGRGYAIQNVYRFA
jgi:hypothetical protein